MADRDRTTLDYVQPGAEERGRLREDFDYNDLNKDGRLTLGEFMRYMREVDENMTGKTARSVSTRWTPTAMARSNSTSSSRGGRRSN